MIPSCARDAFTQPLLDNFSLQSVMEPYLQINPAVFDKSVTTMMTERKWWPDIDWRRQLFGGSNEEEDEEDEGANIIDTDFRAVSDFRLKLLIQIKESELINLQSLPWIPQPDSVSEMRFVCF